MANAMGMNAQVPPGTNPSQQQAYTDAINAMAMQQAAAVAMGQPVPFLQQVQFQGMQAFPVAMTGQPAAAPVDSNQQQVVQEQQEQPQQEQPQQQAAEPQQG